MVIALHLPARTMYIPVIWTNARNITDSLAKTFQFRELEKRHVRSLNLLDHFL